jgi:HK97 family phage portal protein
MSLLSRLFGKSEKRSNYIDPSNFSMAGVGSGITITEDTALNFNAVWSAIRILSESVSQLPVQLVERKENGDKINKSDHYLYNIVSVMPNEYMTRYVFFNKVMVDLCSYGNSYIFIQRNQNARVEKLTPLDASKIVLKEYDDKYFYEDQKTKEIYDIEDLLHFKILSKDGMVGMSPIDTCANSIGYGLALEEYGNSYFRNGAKVSGVLQTDRSLTTEAVERLRNSFDMNYSRVHQANKTLILEEGLKFNQISLSNEASQFLASRRFSIEEIARIFSIPPHLLRDMSKSSFNNIQEQSREFVQYSLMPYMVMIEQELNCKLFKKSEKNKLQFEFNANALLRGNPKDRAEYYRTMINIGAMTINEVRQKENMNVKPEGDNLFMQLNMTTVKGIVNLDDTEEEETEGRALVDVDLTPTDGMIEEAKKALEWRKEYGRGGTAVGVRSARMIISNSLTVPRIKKMFAYFKRHEVDKKAEGFSYGEDGFPSAGRIAWGLWGGDAGAKWSERKRNEIEREEQRQVSAKMKKALQKKVEDHNEDVKDLKKDWNPKVTLAKLIKVFDRGVGAYHTNPGSVRPSVKSPEQWALARVNSFNYAMKNGKFRGGKHDTDLLPTKHPVRIKMKEDKK